MSSVKNALTDGYRLKPNIGLFLYDFMRELELDDNVGWVFGSDKMTFVDDILLKR